MSDALTPVEIARIASALEKSGLSANDGDYSRALDRFGAMLPRLTVAQRELLLTLLDDFACFGAFRSTAILIRLLEGITTKHISDCDVVVVLPLASSGRDGRPKSSSWMLYMARYTALATNESLQGKPILHYESMVSAHAASIPGRRFFLFLDDFVGTGQTAEAAITWCRANLWREGDRLLVVALVTLKAGKDRLTGLNVPFKYDVLKERGISDSQAIADKPKALEIMDEIELGLAVPPRFKHGFAKSEALVKMIRTPNNTFPVFWVTQSWKDNSQWPAPFPRD